MLAPISPCCNPTRIWSSAVTQPYHTYLHSLSFCYFSIPPPPVTPRLPHPSPTPPYHTQPTPRPATPHPTPHRLHTTQPHPALPHTDHTPPSHAPPHHTPTSWRDADRLPPTFCDAQVCLLGRDTIPWPLSNVSSPTTATRHGPTSMLPVAGRLRVARRLCSSGFAGSPPSAALERQHHWHEVEQYALHVAAASCLG